MIALRRQSAFTLIELLVVIAVIAILIGAIIGVSSSVIAGGKARDTQAMLLVLDQAIEQFKEDMLERPRFSGSTKTNYETRYGVYPPDELEAFTDDGDFDPNTFLPTISPGSGVDLTDDGGTPLDLTDVQNRGAKAMALAIKLYSPAGGDFLDLISDRFRRTMGNRQDDFHGDDSVEQLDRTVPEPLVYFVDAWGTPIDYFATNDITVTADSDPSDLRRDASTAFVRANNGVPLLVSYGPDGLDQFAQDFIDAEGETDLVADFHGDDPVRTIDHRLNADNVYSDPDIAEKLAAGLPDPDA